MIVRRWTGTVSAGKAREYIALMTDIAIPDYRRIAGNAAAFCLWRPCGDSVEVTMLTFWQDMEAIEAFAGASPQTAKYYAFDAGFLLSMPEEVEHAEVAAGDLGPAFMELVRSGGAA